MHWSKFSLLKMAKSSCLVTLAFSIDIFAPTLFVFFNVKLFFSVKTGQSIAKSLLKTRCKQVLPSSRLESFLLVLIVVLLICSVNSYRSETVHSNSLFKRIYIYGLKHATWAYIYSVDSVVRVQTCASTCMFYSIIKLGKISGHVHS